MDLKAKGLLLSVLFVASSAVAGPGDPDLTFAPNPNGIVDEIKPESQGSSLVSGRFSSIGGMQRAGIARINSDGLIDPNFAPQFSGGGARLIPLANGKIMAAGTFTEVNGVPRIGLALLKADGAVDISFDLQWHGGGFPVGGPPPPPGSSAYSCEVLAALSSGDVIVRARNMFNLDNSPAPSLAKVSQAGVVAPFSLGLNYAHSVWPLQNGKLLVSYFTNEVTRIVRHNSDGSVDSAFAPFTGGFVNQALETADGKILLLGMPAMAYTGGAIGRLDQNGAVDLSYRAELEGTVRSGYLEADGSLVIAGYFSRYSETNVFTIARLRPSGDFDPGFRPATGRQFSVFQVSRAADGSVFAGGEGRIVNAQHMDTLRRLEGDSPTSGGSFVFAASRIEAQEGARARIQVERASGQNGPASVDVVLSENSATAGTDFDGTAIHLEFAAGEKSKVAEAPVAADNISEPVESFTAELRNPSSGAEIGWQSRARILIVDNDGPASVISEFKFKPFGYADVRDFSILSDGSMIVVGDFTRVQGAGRPGIAKLRSDGSLDANFVPGIPQFAGLEPFRVEAVVAEASGKILVSGIFPRPGNIYQTGVYRLNGDGSVDSFLGSVDQNGVHLALALQDSKVLIFGGFHQFNNIEAAGAVRVNEDGSIDQTFSPASLWWAYRVSVLRNGDIFLVGDVVRRLTANGEVIFEKSFSAEDFIEMPDGKILLGGSFKNATQCVMRLLPDGSEDETFVSDFSAFFWPVQTSTIAMQPNGKLLTGINGYNRDDAYLVRLLASGQIDTTFAPVHFTGSYLGHRVIKRLAVDADGSILAGGLFREADEISELSLARLKGGEEAVERVLLLRSIDTGGKTNTTVTLSVPPFKSFIVERSSDLRGWSPLSTNVSVSARFDFDAGSAASEQMFYRTRLIP